VEVPDVGLFEIQDLLSLIEYDKVPPPEFLTLNVLFAEELPKFRLLVDNASEAGLLTVIRTGVPSLLLDPSDSLISLS
jgi:hypothetical protein